MIVPYFVVFIATFPCWMARNIAAFQPTTTPWWIGSRHRVSPSTSTALFYQANATGELPDTTDNPSRTTRRHPSAGIGTTCIPVIGPLYHSSPLVVIGTTFWLDPPTPLQWKTLEVCVDAWKDRHDANPLATVDAAPLVAVVEEGSDLAVIAAILGYQPSSSSTTAASSSSSSSFSKLDTFDATSFRESLAGLSTVPYYKDTSKVRLLCIGRAKLSDYWHMTTGHHPPTTTSVLGSHQEDMDQTWEENDDTSMCHSTEPVLMATMKLFLDTSTTRPSSKGNEFGSMSSPVHALSQLSMWSSRIHFLHNDRQKLTQAIQAIQTRLEILSEEWQDWDGIGTLYDDAGDLSSESDQKSHARQDSVMPSPRILNAHSLSPRAARLLELENYGMGTTSSAFCDLHTLTKVLIEVLRPYYSPEHTNTEEFEYCLFSWVAMQSLVPFLLGTQELKSALTSSNTVDRMNLIYQAMSAHKEALHELAMAKGKELKDCGEECDIL